MDLIDGTGFWTCGDGIVTAMLRTVQRLFWYRHFYG
jgi:hypothetical protein